MWVFLSSAVQKFGQKSNKLDILSVFAIVSTELRIRPVLELSFSRTTISRKKGNPYASIQVEITTIKLEEKV